MSIGIPALSGSESAVGLVRESTWGTTPVTGSDPNKTINGIVFIPIKTETLDINKNVEPQTDDMVADREIQRIVTNGATVEGGITFTPGPESIGYLFTAMFGTPTTSTLAATSGTAEAAYQHIWYPALNTRANWPAPYSIESILAATKSKLSRGCIIRSLPIDLPNNAVATCSPDFLAKDQIILGSASAATDSTGRTVPAKMTAAPTFLCETEWHWRHLVAYPQIDDVDQQSVTSLSFNFAFPGIEGIFTGGSGVDIGTFRVDNFQLTGRATILFEDETIWNKIYNGADMKIEAELKGDLIQGAHYNKLSIVAYTCKVSSPGTSNQVGNLEYSLDWSAKQSCTDSKSCQITLINTVASYA